MTTVNPRHLSLTVEHMTPPDIVECARVALGGNIDLDPASTAKANLDVKARAYYTKEDNALIHPWNGNVFLNPPGGKVDGQSQQKLFWQYLMQEYRAKRTKSAVFLSFSLEFLQTSQVKPYGLPTPHDFIVCFPSRRIAYFTESGERGASPPHASCVIYVGTDWTRFRKAFAGVGLFMGPVLPSWVGPPVTP